MTQSHSTEIDAAKMRRRLRRPSLEVEPGFKFCVFFALIDQIARKRDMGVRQIPLDPAVVQASVLAYNQAVETLLGPLRISRKSRRRQTEKYSNRKDHGEADYVAVETQTWKFHENAKKRGRI